ncbi:MAG: hypothetical protein ACRDP8_08210 [Actinopolymorphaceae bacterium]
MSGSTTCPGTASQPRTPSASVRLWATVKLGGDLHHTAQAAGADQQDGEEQHVVEAAENVLAAHDDEAAKGGEDACTPRIELPVSLVEDERPLRTTELEVDDVGVVVDHGVAVGEDVVAHPVAPVRVTGTLEFQCAFDVRRFLALDQTGLLKCSGTLNAVERNRHPREEIAHQPALTIDKVLCTCVITRCGRAEPGRRGEDVVLQRGHEPDHAGVLPDDRTPFRGTDMGKCRRGRPHGTGHDEDDDVPPASGDHSPGQ